MIRPFLASLLTLLALRGVAAPPPKGATTLLETRRTLAKERGLPVFSLLEGRLDRETREALQWLLTALPLADLAEDAGTRLLADVQASVEARRATPWGPKLPEELFRTYVLPPRVFDEPLDAFRSTTYRELLARVKHLGMREAALEVNLWCLSKTTFQGTDPRTAAPLTTLGTTYGRCSELSVLLVSALRAVAIPARFVQVPRWAHQDSFHAWVEVWVDGAWHYMGAAEPRPLLDQAWFSDTTRRAPWIQAVALGPGAAPVPAGTMTPVEVVDLTPRYAAVRPVRIRLRDAAGRPIPNTPVVLSLCNDGNLRAIGSMLSDAQGMAVFSAGRTDLLAGASGGGRHGFRMVRADEAETVELVLDQTELPASWDLDFQTPFMATKEDLPPAGPAFGARIDAADQLRKATQASFPDASTTARLAEALGYPAAIAPRIQAALGNAPRILTFLEKAAPRRQEAMALLACLTEKDLREVSPEALLDHLPEPGAGPEALDPDVLRPRVDKEPLREGRRWLRARVPAALAREAHRSPERLAAWFQEQVKVDPTPSPLPLSVGPRATLQLGIADARGRDVSFVALCRALGLPARLDFFTRLPLVRLDGTWHEVGFGPPRVQKRTLGGLVLKPAVPGLRLGEHVGLSRIGPDGLVPLELPYMYPLDGISTPLPLPAGPYVLVTSQRLTGGTVLARLTRFTVTAGVAVEVPVVLRTAPQAPSSFSRSR